AAPVTADGRIRLECDTLREPPASDREAGMTDKRTAPFGSWASPITGATIAGQSIGIGGPVVADGRLYWTESRPSEGGRTVLVRRRPDGSTADLTPPPFNVRSRVHEYGGTALAIAGDTICFVNFSDQRL